MDDFGGDVVDDQRLGVLGRRRRGQRGAAGLGVRRRLLDFAGFLADPELRRPWTLQLDLLLPRRIGAGKARAQGVHSGGGNPAGGEAPICGGEGDRNRDRNRGEREKG